MTFGSGERLAVWEYATGHKKLVSIIEAEPTRALICISYVNRKHQEWTTYDKLARRSDGQALTYAMVIEGYPMFPARRPA